MKELRRNPIKVLANRQVTFAERIVKIRVKRGYTREGIAALIGAEVEFINQLEQGKTQPTIEIAKIMAKELNISLDYLVGNIDQELDQNSILRALEIQSLPNEIKEKIFSFIDISINLKA